MDKKYPRPGDIVFCTVQRITPFAAWCRLDEYSDENQTLEGMVHVSQVAGKWVKDIRNFVKPNKQYVAKVIRVDRSKGHINLSLKQVSKFDKRQKIEDYRKNMRARNILEQAAKSLNKNLEDAYEEVGSKLEEQFDTLFAAFEEESKNPETLEEAGVPKKWASALKGLIGKTFEKKEVTIKAMVELTTLDSDGIEKIKDILHYIEKETGVKPRYISAPTYSLEVTTKDPKNTERKIKAALDSAVKKIESAHGSGNYKLVK